LTKEKIRQKTVSHGAVPSSYYMVSVCHCLASYENLGS
jgi:hypothetical protein